MGEGEEGKGEGGGNPTPLQSNLWLEVGCCVCVGMVEEDPALSHYYMYAYGWLNVGVYITRYGSTLYIGIA